MSFCVLVDMYGPVYNYLFQNEWCEVSILPVERERSEIALFTTDESPCQVSELWVDQSCNDWRTLSGIDSGAQGWGQLAGKNRIRCHWSIYHVSHVHCITI